MFKFQFAYNTVPHAGLRISPFFMNHARETHKTDQPESSADDHSEESDVDLTNLFDSPPPTRARQNLIDNMEPNVVALLDSIQSAPPPKLERSRVEVLI